MRVHRSLEQFDPTRPLKPWVSRIAYNVCLRRLERVSRKRTELREPERFGELPDERAPRPDEQAHSNEEAALLGVALEALPAQDRALITLHYNEGLSMAELSESTDMPVNTVKTRLRRARLKLREVLTPRLSRRT